MASDQYVSSTDPVRRPAAHLNVSFNSRHRAIHASVAFVRERVDDLQQFVLQTRNPSNLKTDLWVGVGLSGDDGKQCATCTTCHGGPKDRRPYTTSALRN